MLDLVVIDGTRARHRHARPGDRQDRDARRRRGGAGTGGYGNVFYLSTNAKGCNVTAIWRAYKQGRRLRQPLLHADPPDLHPGQRRLPVEADADERVAAQRRPHLGAEDARATRAPPDQIPEDERDYYLERKYPSFGNLVPRDIASRAAKEVCDEGRGVGPRRPRRLPRFRRRHQAPRAQRTIGERYGNLFEMYERITGENPYKVPMRIYPAIALHDGRAVGGLQPDEHDPRPVRRRRGELLRPRRQPPGRQRADAGPGRRLLRPALHDRRLPGQRTSSSKVDAIHPEVARSARGRRRSARSKLLGDQGQAHASTRSTASSAS